MPRYTQKLHNPERTNSVLARPSPAAAGTHTNARPCRSPLADPLYLTSTTARESVRLGIG